MVCVRGHILERVGEIRLSLHLRVKKPRHWHTKSVARFLFSKERIVFFPMNHETMQAVSTENPVVDAFRGHSLVIDFFISFRATRHICIKADIPIGPCFYNASIFSG